MSELRQPVKGKPHIVPCRLSLNGKHGLILSDFSWPTARGDERVHISNWARGIDHAWTRWWRQHQEAA